MRMWKCVCENYARLRIIGNEKLNWIIRCFQNRPIYSKMHPSPIAFNVLVHPFVKSLQVKFNVLPTMRRFICNLNWFLCGREMLQTISFSSVYLLHIRMISTSVLPLKIQRQNTKNFRFLTKNSLFTFRCSNDVRHFRYTTNQVVVIANHSIVENFPIDSLGWVQFSSKLQILLIQKYSKLLTSTDRHSESTFLLPVTKLTNIFVWTHY